MSRNLLSVLSACWIGLLPLAAKADVQEAVEAYKKGYAFFFANRFEEALPLFLRFQTLLPKEKRYRRAHAEVKYYIGISHYQRKAYLPAKRSLEEYLQDGFRKKDKDTSAKETLVAIQEIMRSAEGSRTPPPSDDRAASPPPRITAERPLPPPPRLREDSKPPSRTVALQRLPPPPSSPPPTQAHPAAWIFLGVGLATLAGGLITGLLAQQKYQETTKTYQERLALGNLTASDVSQPFATAQDRGLIATALYAAGGGITAAGLIMIFTWRIPFPPR